MEGTAPAALSALARCLVRRPPVLSDVVMLLRYSEDYGWFVDLTRHLFPEESGAIQALPGIRERVARFCALVDERNFPLDLGYIDYFLSDETRPPCTWLRRGIPFRLLGFSYDDFHEMWVGHRDGISSLALLTKSQYEDHIGNEQGIRVYWLESAAERIPQATLDRIPGGGIDADVFRRALEGTRFEGAAKGASWVWGETGSYYLDCTCDDGSYEGFCDPWDDDIIKPSSEQWGKANKLLEEVDKMVDWLEEDLATRFAELLDFVLQRLPEIEEEEEDHE